MVDNSQKLKKLKNLEVGVKAILKEFLCDLIGQEGEAQSPRASAGGGASPGSSSETARTEGGGHRDAPLRQEAARGRVQQGDPVREAARHEIPFEKRPAIGFYDTASEVFQKEAFDFRRLRQDNLEKKNEHKMQPTRAGKKDKEPEKDLGQVLSEASREPQRKRSKLVLPAPQISDLELEEIVKVGVASEQARLQAEEATPGATGTLLASYQMTPDLARLRTPLLPASQDTLLTEAQDILALQVVDTPLKGGLNTPLHTTQFSAGATPLHKPVHTPNTVFATPFRTPHGEVSHTPARLAGGEVALLAEGARTPAVTPAVRDKLSINPEEAFAGFEDKERQRDSLQVLKRGLAKLPAPKNDYEIVLPEEGQEEVAMEVEGEQAEVLDEAEVQLQRREAKRAQEQEERKFKSKAVQRCLPRPSDMNHNVLRPADMAQPLSDYQQAEELIKEEMLVMLHHDVLTDPTLSQCGIPAGTRRPAGGLKPLHADRHQSYLKGTGYERFTLEEIQQVRTDFYGLFMRAF